MEGAEDEDEAGEGGVGGDGLEPVVVDVEEQHLRLRRPAVVLFRVMVVLVFCGLARQAVKVVIIIVVGVVNRVAW